jgi:hypothetical protein
LNSKKIGPIVALILLFTVSLFVTFSPFRKATPDFYVGVEFAYSHNLNSSQVIFSDLKALVDKVEGYTNLFIIGIPEVSLNQTLLTQSCDYITGKADLSVIVLYKDTTKYNYNLSEWTHGAERRYGNKFIGVYRIDEPGGKELDNATFGGLPDRFLNQKDYNPNVRNYKDAADLYVHVLRLHIDALRTFLYPKIFTSDYGLYWFDYRGGYESIFGEFVWNNSRQIALSACRGAAHAQGKDWGVMVTWKYDKPPYIEDGQQLYDDLILAYKAGAKYAAVFNYPAIGQYGIFTDEHFDALKNFWNYVKSNPKDHGAQPGKVAYVLPEGYGFGLRRPDDNIWGVWGPDDLASKVWTDTNKLLSQYGLNLDIVYDDPEFISAVTNRYEQLFFWNKTIT